MNKSLKAIAVVLSEIVLFLLTIVAAPLAASAEEGFRPALKIVGRKDATVTTTDIRLGDIAEVSSPLLIDDEAVIGLQKIIVDKSPNPGREMTLSAAQIIERMREEGVNLKGVGYFLPRIITVKRASRTVTKTEIGDAITAYLREEGDDITLRDIVVIDAPEIAPGAVSMTVKSGPASPSGKRTFQIKAEVAGAEAVQVRAEASVDSWREVPVARRAMFKGEVVGEADVIMARLNSDRIPGDSMPVVKNIVGLEVSRDMGSGELFRKQKLATPRVIEAGEKVTMQYSDGIFEATATGIAMEAGGMGENIKIRNESSKRIVTGKIIGSGLVGVN